jgi:hypothetical protein
MSQKTTSLDIQKGEGSVIDIAQVFPMTMTRTLDLARHGEAFSDIVSINTSEPIDLREDAKIRISRFHTIETLDLATPEVVDPTRWEAGLLDMVSRPRIHFLSPMEHSMYGVILSPLRLSILISMLASYR